MKTTRIVMPFLSRKFLCYFLMLVSLLSLAAPGLFAQEDYPLLLIGPGDLLVITVLSKEKLPEDFMVDSDGQISFPFVGRVKLQGLTQAEAGEFLAKQLSNYIQRPQVTVFIKESNNYNVSILGQVSKPGKYLIRGKPSVLSVLAEAGGPLDSADLNQALIIRDEKKIGLNLNDYLNNKSYVGREPLVYPGDILVVPKNAGLSSEEWAILATILSSTAIVLITLNK